MKEKIFRTMAWITVGITAACGIAGCFFVPMRQLSVWAALVFCFGVIALGLCYFLSGHISQKIAEPLNRLDLENPLENEACRELAPLMGRINQQYIEISSHLRMLRRKTGEFEQIIRHMKEGLVLLDSETTILSINPAAKALFGADGMCIGKSFFTVERSQQMRDAVNEALDKGHGAVHLERGGRVYQFDLSRINSDSSMAGVVVLAIDVTDQVNAERNRREFSANVSHELKTPLQSIIGSAELLENGLVLPQDTPRFVGHIRKEAARLVALVEDIIRLSQLDEGAPLPKEDVELTALCREAAEELQDAARAKEVTLTVTGEETVIPGIRRLLYEIVFNLCDNAIKYNVTGGSVTVTVTGGNTPSISVKDTGIGIPAEHQGRVFERFYRVDKSHSKLSGGTGLGLSIVKHAAAYHNAKLSLQSKPGEGTVITVDFLLKT
ncbi:MAG: PAS domain-containing protein [Oscillospiraceae bacterium]|nr:PAS domain-containing protein [Oscillospiraceae bacterium]